MLNTSHPQNEMLAKPLERIKELKELTRRNHLSILNKCESNDAIVG
jgi:uncharacterized protein YeaO (DUF488 family)